MKTFGSIQWQSCSQKQKSQETVETFHAEFSQTILGACSPAGGSSQVKEHVQMLQQKCVEVHRKDMKKEAAQFHLGSTIVFYEPNLQTPRSFILIFFN